MRRLIAGCLAVTCVVTAGCTAAKTPDRSAKSPGLLAVSNQPTEKLNPKVTPPPRKVTVNPNLAVVNPPAGYLPFAEAKAKALALESCNDCYGTLTLSALTFDEPNHSWEAEFTTDGLVATGPRSHPGDFGNNPVERRGNMRSWTSIASSIMVSLDGKTGEPVGGGFRSGKPDQTRTDLEHYRGRIVTLGGALRLRLVNADGSREGRDLEVALPDDVLDAAGLKFWQVYYGTGREMDVWGLTSRPGLVSAYKIAMPSPPPESVLSNDIVWSLPLYPGAYVGPEPDTIKAKGADLTAMRDWYTANLPTYGWQAGKTAGDFETAAWDRIHLDFTTVNGDVRISIKRP